MTDKIAGSRRRAAVALAAYREAHDAERIADPDDQAAIRDLIVDLLHLNAGRSGQPEHNRYIAAQSVTRVALDEFEHESDPANAHEHVYERFAR